MRDPVDVTQDPHALLKVREVCALLGFTERTVREAIRNGALRVVRLNARPGRGVVRVRRSDLEDFIELRSSRPSKKAGGAR
jgi:excisionase family DNA binding protein